MAESHLFSPLVIRGVTLPNRIAVSPMCQYSSQDGFATDWHLVHLGSRAVGGAGLVLTEATAVLPEGRITPWCLGLWKDEHAEGLARIARFIRAQGAIPGIQLAHAGRKASTRRPWDLRTSLTPAEGAWTPLGPTAEPYGDGWPTPRALDDAGIGRVVAAFRDAAARALDCGFEIVEVHGAHGYLVDSFVSPAVNRRVDGYGGDAEARGRLAVEVCRAIREVWPERLPLLIRLSVTDWLEGGKTVDDTVALAGRLSAEGVDLVDCSSGGAHPGQRIPVGPGYQIPLASAVRTGAGIPTGAVGLITEPGQADAIIRGGQADLVLLARELLRAPYWPRRAARELGHDTDWPPQYLRSKPPGPG